MRNIAPPKFLIAVFLAGFCFSTTVYCLGLQVEPPHLPGFHPLDEKTQTGNIFLRGHPALLTLNSKLFSDKQNINFEKRQITFSREDALGFAIWQYHYAELSDYLASRQRFSLYRNWAETEARKASVAGEKKGTGALEFALPVQYPSWAQRILGKEPPKLTINGSLSITVQYQNDHQDPPVQGIQASNQGFNFNQENAFTIVGSIGRLISINIKASSQEFDMNDPLKDFKVMYKGEGNELEDEIIQEVVAGYTGFDMPATQLSGYSESHEGLFGIKVTSKFGPLTLTTIASHEQGESQKLTQGSGSSSSGQTERTDGQYLANTFFFLDTVYLKQYKKRGAHAPDTLAHLPAIKTLNVWVQADAVELSNPVPGNVYKNVAAFDSSSTRFQPGGTDGMVFKLLKENYHYYVNRQQGYIRIDSMSSRPDNKYLAISLTTSDPAAIPDKGDETVIDTSSFGNRPTIKRLWMLKEIQPDTTQRSFYLMWRNVYELPKNIPWENFTITVSKTVDTTESKDRINGKLISEILKLTGSDGKALHTDISIFDDQNGYLVLPLFEDTAIGNQPFNNPALDKERNPKPYTYSQTDYNADNSADKVKFKISMTGTVDSKKTVFDLGWGVLQGTELVKADGSKLERDRDYVIDYQTGTLELTSKAAKAAKNVSIEYQRESIFVPEQKIFLGARGQIQLPFFSDNSFIGASVLYQDASTRDQIPRIGYEPYRKLLLDLNTKLDFEPEWMTKAVDAIPLVKTETASHAAFEFEVAHSFMNPNTHNEAYVDDFEASKQTYPLGESPLSWYQASPPADFDIGPKLWGALTTRPPAWDQYWFSPVDNDAEHRVTHSRIWNPDPNAPPLTAQEKYERVLFFGCQPAPADTMLANQYVDPWAGIMTPVPASFANREKDKYFEFYAHDSGGGRLYIDMGVISEETCLDGKPPDGSLHTEDSIGDNAPDPRFDRGLDWLFNNNEHWWVPNLGTDTFVSIDSLWPSVLPPRPDDPGRDSFKVYDADHLQNYKYFNGLEGDGRLSSQDIDNDGFLMQHNQERVFRAVIDFDSLHAANFDTSRIGAGSKYFLVSSGNVADSGWHLYRIPINSLFLDSIASKSGQKPNWKEIRSVRLWWSGFKPDRKSRPNSLQLTRIQFVGNQWQEIPIATGDSANPYVHKMDISVINTTDDALYASHLPFSRPKDAQGYDKPEQSVKLTFSNVLPGDQVLASRSYSFQALNLTSYEQLSMLVHSNGTYFNQGLHFVFRFGTDTNSFYEYRTEGLYEGWDNRNNPVITLKKFSELKLEFFKYHQDSVSTGDTLDATGHYRLYFKNGRQPTFSNITWMALGVVRDSGGLAPGLDGEIWVDEMKVTGIRALSGWAARASLTTQWADFMGINLSANYRDGDFRQMTDAAMIPSNSLLEANLKVDWKLEKFLPSSWGIAIPLGTTVSGSLNRPQLKPGTDIYLTDSLGRSDDLADMATDMVNMFTGYTDQRNVEKTSASHFETRQMTKTWYTGYDKTVPTPNPVLGLLTDRVSIDYNYSLAARNDGRGEAPKGDSDFVKRDTTWTYKGVLKYDLSPREPPKWTKWKPFDLLKSPWMPSRLRQYELSLLPTTVNFVLADASYTVHNYRDDLVMNNFQLTKSFALNHGFKLDYTPISPLLQTSYNITVNRNLDSAVSNKLKWAEFIQDTVFDWNREWKHWGLLRGEQQRTQNFSLGLKPQFFDWLTHTADYKADYNERLVRLPNEQRDYLNLGVNTTFSFNGSLDIGGILRGLVSQGSSPPSSQYGGPPGKGKPNSPTPDGKQAKSATPKTGDSWIAAVQRGFDRFGLRSINVTYTAASNLANNNIGTEFMNGSNTGPMDFLAYQIGKKGRSVVPDMITGNTNDITSFGGMRYRALNGDSLSRYANDTRHVQRDYSVNTALNIPEPVDISINTIKLGGSKKFTARPDTLGWDTAVTFPSVGLGASSPMLKKIALIGNVLNQINVTSSYNYDETHSKTGRSTEPDDSWNHSFSPLIQIDGTLKKWPVNMKYSHTLSSKKRHSAGWFKDKQNGDDFSMSYSIQKAGGMPDIKLFMWTIPIQGRTDLSLKMDHTQELDYERKENEGQLQTGDPERKSDAWSLVPEMKYTFTDNITGTVRYTGSIKSDKVTTVKSHLAELIVEIRF